MTTFAKQPIRLLEGKVYIGMDVLVELGVSYETIEQGYKRNSRIWQKIDDPEDARRVLIAYEPLRQQYKDLVIQQFGDPSEWLRLQQEQQARALAHSSQEQAIAMVVSDLKPSTSDISFFSKQLANRPDQERTLVARQYAILAAFIDYCIHIKPADCRRYGYQSKDDFLDKALQKCHDIGLHFPVKIGSVQLLRRKMSEVKTAHAKDREKALLALMKEGKYRNTNRNRIKDEEQVLTLLAFAAMSQKMPFSKVCEFYNVRAIKLGWHTVSERTVLRFLNRPDIEHLYYKARHGRDAFLKKYDPSTNRKAPTAINAMWVMDGTPLDWVFCEEQFYLDPTGQRKKRLNRWSKMYLYMVIDAATWKIIGYYLAYSEDHTVIVNALREAVRHTMLLPHQMQYDNSKANKKLQSLLNGLALYNTPSAPYNAKSKVIEAITGHFQQEVLRFHGRNFTGQNITSRKLDSRANPDALKESLKEYYSKEQLMHDLQQAVNFWNNMDTKERVAPNIKEQLLIDAKKNAGREIDPEIFLSLFYVLDSTAITYCSNGITTKINKQKYRFVAPQDTSLHLRLVGQKFQLKYDPETLEYAYIYQDNRIVLDDNNEPVVLYHAAANNNLPMAIYDYQEGDGAKVQAHIKFQKNVRAHGDNLEKWMRQTQAELNITIGHIYAEKDELNDSEHTVKMLQVLDDDDDKDDFLTRYNNPYKH